MAANPISLALLGTLILWAEPTRASEIVWDSPQDITGHLVDFETTGTIVHAWNAGGSNFHLDPGGLDIQFTPGPLFANGAVANMDYYNRQGNAAYESLLGTMTWASSTATLNLVGLIPGNQYRVQLWMADTRSTTQHRQKTYDSGPGTTQVVLDSGPPSEFVTGSFVADATSQPLRCVGSGGADHPQYNLLILRDLGPPTPKITQYELRDGPIQSDVGLWITSGESVTLHWTVNLGDSVTISPDLGSVASSGSQTLTPTTTQTYRIEATNDVGTTRRTVTVYVDEPVTPLQISEILTSNERGLEDEEGDREDWIELSNPNPFPVPLEGYALSDERSLKNPWLLPADRAIPAHGYLLIFASGKDRRGTELHTDFKLSAEGEYLALLHQGNVVAQLPSDYPATASFPQFPQDFSYGIGPSGANRFFDSPTPGSANGEGHAGFTENLRISLDHGFYESPQTLAIQSDTPGAIIHYTTDGTLPSATHGNLYAGPIPISTTTLLRAIAFKPDFAPTAVISQTYLFAEDVIASPVMNRSITQAEGYRTKMKDALLSLPTLSLAIHDTRIINNTSEQPSSVEFIPTDGSTGFQVDAGVTNFGGYFTDFAKKNFRLYFRSKYGPTKLRYPLFKGFENGWPTVDKFDSLDLRSGSHDMEMRGAYLSNRFTDNTMLEMGHLNPHGRFVHLFINGVYWGQYHLRERWSAAMAADYFGGEKSDYEAINGNANVGGWAPGLPADGDGRGWQTIKQLAAGPNPWQTLPRRVDLANYIDYMLLYMSGDAENEYRNINQTFNGGVGLKMVHNDADGFLRPPPSNRLGDPGPGNILGALRAQGHPDFQMLLADRIQKHYFNGGAFTPDRTIPRLQKQMAATQLSFLCESARWGYRTPQSWQNYNDNLLNNDLPGRTALMIGRFRNAGFYPTTNAPQFNQDGGIVTPGFELHASSPSGGLIYLTENGEDPRLPGGGIHPAAIVVENSSHAVPLISQGAIWRYHDSGSNLGTEWREADYADGHWASGAAKLGYGEGDERTVLSFGTNSSRKHITTYFRKTFQVEDPSQITQLTLELLRDDGAVVYLNGREILRSNMPQGTINHTTLASSAIGGANEQAYSQYNLSPNELSAGINTLAVEIHQVNPTSTDLSFDLRLLATTQPVTQPALVLSNGRSTIKARALVDGVWSAIRELQFVVAQHPRLPLAGDLVVSEIHYHPADPTAEESAMISGLEDNDFEYLEIMNISSDSLRLDGCEFTRGITFVFGEDMILDPGERLILCHNPSALSLRHAIAPHGTFIGSLNNAGEAIRLVSAAGAILIDFSYGDNQTPNWPASADGGGKSLVLIHPRSKGNLSDPFEWRSSIYPDGSPATSDSLSPIHPHADDDGDGVSAWMEALLMSSDLSASSLPKLETFLMDRGDTKDVFHLRVQRDLRVEASLEAQFSEDLQDWTQSAILYQRVRLNEFTEILEYHSPMESATGGYLRVRASH
jgi:hypothetical protein